MTRIVLLLFAVCCAACNQKSQPENIISVDMDHPEKVSLSDYFKSIELIPLETDTNVLMKTVSRLIRHQTMYYILDMPQAVVFVFDQSGRFLYKIDKQGKGPGEYSSIEDIHINQSTGLLELLTAYGFIYEFDLSGNYIRTKRVSYPGFRAVHQFAAIDSSIYVFYAMFQPKKIIYYDIAGEKLLRDEYEESQEIGSFGYDNLYPYQGEWYFYRPFHPSVYIVGKSGLEEAFRFDFGKYTRDGTKAIFSEESRHSLKKMGEEAFAQFPYWLRKVGHNNQYIFAQVPWGDANDRSNVVYDKSTRKGKLIPVFDEQVEFEPNIVTDAYILSWCKWVELEKRIKKEMLDDEQKIIFERLMQSEIETNPILIKYNFK